jgi:hypothetical protein
VGAAQGDAAEAGQDQAAAAVRAPRARLAVLPPRRLPPVNTEGGADV